jgi:ABC-type dipeptide/oligopeptide/nickel transport system ATPase subunit
MLLEHAVPQVIASALDSHDPATGAEATALMHELGERGYIDLEAKVADAPQKREQGEALTTERRQLLDELAQGRREESRLVEEAARALRQRVGRRVRVVVNPLSDRSQVLELLQNAVRGQSVRRDQLDKLSETPPSSLAAAIRAGADELLKLGCSDATAARIGAMPLSVVHQIEEAATPDAILIEVDLGAPGNEQWSSVKKVSPGQRATAMLALALATGTEPLIIDQPEDDLDNRYIFDEVVSVIANVCEGRQVLVATHNANIPILGDAELVIAFDAVADRSVVMACGPLEEPTVAQKAREILEGGDEAFMARHRRYLSARKELER